MLLQNNDHEPPSSEGTESWFMLYKQSKVGNTCLPVPGVNMKLNYLCASVLLAASASTYAVGPGSLGSLDNSSASIGQVVGSGLFVDTYSFSLASAGTVFGGAFSLFVEGFQVELIDSAFTSYGTDTDLTDGFSFAGLSAGDYALQFAGFSTSANGVYGGTVAAIPEPETYAMLLAGLGIVGFMARRRQQG